MYMLVYGLRTDGRGMGGLVEWVDGWTSGMGGWVDLWNGWMGGLEEWVGCLL